MARNRPKQRAPQGFTATGKATQLDLIDVADNILPELEGLRTLAGLLQISSDEMDAEGLQGLGLILRGMEARMRCMVDDAVGKTKPPRRS